jgi:hypothetical protein
MNDHREVTRSNSVRYEVLWYKDFINRKKQEMQHLKSQLTITVYGSYYPPRQKQRLIKLKKLLMKNGYALTRLVEDYPEKDYHCSHSYEERICAKSQYCLEFSDVNFFIFTHKGKCQGVSVELAYCNNSPMMVDRRWRSVIFDENIDGSPASSFMDRGANYVASGRIKRIEFKDDSELWRLACEVADEFLLLLYPCLIQRFVLLT